MVADLELVRGRVVPPPEGLAEPSLFPLKELLNPRHHGTPGDREGRRDRGYRTGCVVEGERDDALAANSSLATPQAPQEHPDEIREIPELTLVLEQPTFDNSSIFIKDGVFLAPELLAPVFDYL